MLRYNRFFLKVRFFRKKIKCFPLISQKLKTIDIWRPHVKCRRFNSEHNGILVLNIRPIFTDLWSKKGGDSVAILCITALTIHYAYGISSCQTFPKYTKTSNPNKKIVLYKVVDLVQIS